MGDYRLLDESNAVVTTFEAHDDERAVEQARGAARRQARGSRVHHLQRAVESAWVDVATWMPRPPGPRRGER